MSMLLPAATLVFMLAEGGQVTLPRTVDPALATKPPPDQVQTTDPLFDRPLVATDDPAFVLAVVESLRQGVIDARAGESGLPTPELRAAAAKIGEQQSATLERLERVAKTKGWRLPQGNPVRSGSVPVVSEARTSANFIVHQITYHEHVVSHFKAQIAGEGDGQLKRELRAALPGYQKNLQMLLGLKL
jgi:hypothetical protein